MHKSIGRGPSAYDNNSRAVLGTLDAGIGETHLNTILTTMIYPILVVVPLKEEKEK